MNRWILAAALVSLLTLAPSAALAHPGHDHKVLGVITAIHGDHVTVKTKDGKERSFTLTPETKLVQGKKKGAVTDLKVGMRLVVNVGDGAEPLKAKEVQYSVAARASS
jgi:hypothetical protein